MKTHILPLDPNCFYHIYNRGINGETLFKNERNYVFFLQKYSQYLCPFVDTYAYCLLNNHFHLLIRTKSEEAIKLLFTNETKFGDKNLAWHYSNAFASFFKSYAQAINKGYNRTGALFEEPFRRIKITNSGYLIEMVYYIHNNPQKHGFIADFRDYPHSSYRALLSTSETRLQREALLSWFGGVEGLKKFHLQKAKLATSKEENFDISENSDF